MSPFICFRNPSSRKSCSILLRLLVIILVFKGYSAKMVSPNIRLNAFVFPSRDSAELDEDYVGIGSTDRDGHTSSKLLTGLFSFPKKIRSKLRKSFYRDHYNNRRISLLKKGSIDTVSSFPTTSPSSSGQPSVSTTPQDSETSPYFPTTSPSIAPRHTPSNFPVASPYSIKTILSNAVQTKNLTSINFMNTLSLLMPNLNTVFNTSDYECDDAATIEAHTQVHVIISKLRSKVEVMYSITNVKENAENAITSSDILQWIQISIAMQESFRQERGALVYSWIPDEVGWMYCGWALLNETFISLPGFFRVCVLSETVGIIVSRAPTIGKDYWKKEVFRTTTTLETSSLTSHRVNTGHIRKESNGLKRRVSVQTRRQLEPYNFDSAQEVNLDVGSSLGKIQEIH